MAEPFKNEFNVELITQMGEHFKRVSPDFNAKDFVAKSTYGLDALELKERSTQIANALVEFLPDNFEEAGNILIDSLAPKEPFDPKLGITSWATWPMNQYVGMQGIEHFEISMKVFKALTPHFSSEFDIRFFLIAEEERTLTHLKNWINDPNHHVRRLVSEGTRPRLPWGIKLQSFANDPTPILPLLDALKDDDEEYVRRSVANSLNDIAKDNPDVVAKIARDWLKGADKNRIWLVKHACRTLIKQGHKKTLQALGYGAPKVSLEKFEIKNKQVKFGSALEFDMVLKSDKNSEQDLIIDYAIHHMKANGEIAPKVFKWKITTLKADVKITAAKKHSIKKITTRKYYNGIHKVEIIINGISFGMQEFELHGV